MRIRFKLVLVLSAILFMILSGCATFNYTKPAPTQQQIISIKVSDIGFTNINDIPMGAYRMPDSPIVVSGHQGKPGATSSFGLLGALAFGTSGSAKGEKLISGVKDNLNFALKKQVMSTLEPLVTSKPHNQFFTLSELATNPVLFIEPAIVLTYVSDTDVMPFVAFKISLSRAGKKEWASRYFSSTGRAKPLSGMNSWTANDSEALKDSIHKSLNKMVTMMLQDISNPLPRNDSNKVLVKGHFPFTRDLWEIVGFQLEDEKQYITVNPCISDFNVFAGVNILDKNTITYRPATKNDPPFKLIKE